MSLLPSLSRVPPCNSCTGQHSSSAGTLTEHGGWHTFYHFLNCISLTLLVHSVPAMWLLKLAVCTHLRASEPTALFASSIFPLEFCMVCFSSLLAFLSSGVSVKPYPAKLFNSGYTISIPCFFSTALSPLTYHACYLFIVCFSCWNEEKSCFVSVFPTVLAAPLGAKPVTVWTLTRHLLNEWVTGSPNRGAGKHSLGEATILLSTQDLRFSTEHLSRRKWLSGILLVS